MTGEIIERVFREGYFSVSDEVVVGTSFGYVAVYLPSEREVEVEVFDEESISRHAIGGSGIDIEDVIDDIIIVIKHIDEVDSFVIVSRNREHIITGVKLDNVWHLVDTVISKDGITYKSRYDYDISNKVHAKCLIKMILNYVLFEDYLFN